MGRRVPITPNRFESAKEMAMSGHSMVAAAEVCGMKVTTYRKRLGKLHKVWANEGLKMLRQATMSSVSKIRDDAKRVDAGLKFLNQYPIDEDLEVAKSDVDGAVDGRYIVDKIMDELDG